MVVYWRLAETKADIKHAVLSGLVILGTTKEGAVTNTCKLYYRSGFVHSGTIFGHFCNGAGRAQCKYENFT